jgi:hypothetical protein
MLSFLICIWTQKGGKVRSIFPILSIKCHDPKVDDREQWRSRIRTRERDEKSKQEVGTRKRMRASNTLLFLRYLIQNLTGVYKSTPNHTRTPAHAPAYT